MAISTRYGGCLQILAELGTFRSRQMSTHEPEHACLRRRCSRTSKAWAFVRNALHSTSSPWKMIASRRAMAPSSSSTGALHSAAPLFTSSLIPLRVRGRLHGRFRRLMQTRTRWATAAGKSAGLQDKASCLTSRSAASSRLDAVILAYPHLASFFSAASSALIRLAASCVPSSRRCKARSCSYQTPAPGWPGRHASHNSVHMAALSSRSSSCTFFICPASGRANVCCGLSDAIRHRRQQIAFLDRAVSDRSAAAL